MRRCPVPGCRGVVQGQKALCLKHWRQVPEPIQKRLWAAWAALRTKKDGSAKVFRDALATARQYAEIPKSRFTEMVAKS